MPTDSAATPAAAATAQVLDHHLRAFAAGVEALLADYTEQSVFQLPDRTLRGLAEIRGFFAELLASIQPGFWEAFRIQRQAVEGEIAYLVWDAKPFVAMATDTLLVRDGKILVQTFTPFAA